MNAITIATETRPLDQADPDWITRQINGRRNDGIDVCVRIQINTSDLNLSFATLSCASSGGGGRAPTPRESAVLALWNKHHLNERNFAAGNVVAFVKELRRLI